MPPPRDHEIGDLVERVRARDESAWGELIDRYSGLLWAVAREMRLGDDDVADVVQTTWLRFVERGSTLRDPRRVGSWLATTVRRECLVVLRRQGRETPLDQWNGPADAEGPGDGLLRREIAADLRRAFERLDPPCQALLRLLMTDPPHSYAQIAQALHTPLGSIGPRRRRCLDRLRSMLSAPATPSAAAEPAGCGAGRRVPGTRTDWRPAMTEPADGNPPVNSDPDQRPEGADTLPEDSRRDAADTAGMMAAARGSAGHVSEDSETVRPQSAPDPSIGPD